MPDSLSRLIQQLTEAVSDLTAQLERGEITIEQWQREMEKLLARYHEAAFMLGQDSAEIDDAALLILIGEIEYQLGFLEAFAAVMAEVGIAAWMPVWSARAAMYAQAPKTTYWQGVAHALNITLPGQPGQSECLARCGCWWDIREVKGGYDAYWRRGKKDSCNGCRLREQKWNPFRIRVERRERA